MLGDGVVRGYLVRCIMMVLAVRGCKRRMRTRKVIVNKRRRRRSITGRHSGESGRCKGSNNSGKCRRYEGRVIKCMEGEKIRSE